MRGKLSTGAKFGKTISWRSNAREKNLTCFQARENIQQVPSAGKQLGDVMREKGIQPVSKRGKFSTGDSCAEKEFNLFLSAGKFSTSVKCGKAIKW